METLKKYWTKRNAKKKIEATDGTPLEYLRKIVKYLNSLAGFSGVKFEKDWKLSFLGTWDAWASAFGYPFCMWYTIIFFPSKDNIALIGGLAFNLTVWNKLIFVIRNQKKFMSLLKFVLDVVELNPSGERARILSDASKKVKYHVNCNVVCSCAGLAVFSAVPMYDCIFKRKLTPVSSMVIPFTVDTGVIGYSINSFFNVLFCVYGLTHGAAVSSMFFLFVKMYNGFVLILEHEIRQFDDMYKRNVAPKNYDKPFRNIMLMFQDLARYNIYVNELYSLITAVQIAASYVVVITCVGGVLALDYRGGVGAVVALYTQLLIYCHIGQLQNDANKHIAEVIVDSAWYTYDVKYQKDMLQAFQIAQNFKSTDLVGVAPLNFGTGLALTRSLYTFTMFMLQAY